MQAEFTNLMQREFVKTTSLRNFFISTGWKKAFCSSWISNSHNEEVGQPQQEGRPFPCAIFMLY